MEYFYKPFKVFSPLKGKVPKYFSNDFEYIAAKARKILKKRSRKEIDFGMKTVNWIMEMADRDNNSIDELISNLGKKENIKPKKLSIIDIYYSPAQWLLNSLGKYDISNQYEFPNAIHAEYFAILALAIIDGVCQEIKNPIIKPLKNKIEEERNNLKSLSHLAFNSMEAISFAEMFYSNKIGEIEMKKAKDLISLQNSSAAIKRHEPGNKLKDKFIEYYYANQPISMNEAAKQFVEKLTPEEAQLFVPTNIERVLKDALREYKKANQNRKIK
jgi:translation elongation factor EF-1beta